MDLPVHATQSRFLTPLITFSQYGFTRSDYLVGSEATGVDHTFMPDHVSLGDGVLEMKVSAYANDQNVLSSQITSNESFKYASVRVVQKSSGVPGVCEGNFFYCMFLYWGLRTPLTRWRVVNDTQEVDWEILTSTAVQGSDSLDAGIWATNQVTGVGQPTTSELVPITFDPSEDFHGNSTHSLRN